MMTATIKQLEKERESLVAAAEEAQRHVTAIDTVLNLYRNRIAADEHKEPKPKEPEPKRRLSPEGEARRLKGYKQYLKRRASGTLNSKSGLKRKPGAKRLTSGFWDRWIERALASGITEKRYIFNFITANASMITGKDWRRFDNAFWRFERKHPNMATMPLSVDEAVIPNSVAKEEVAAS